MRKLGVVIAAVAATMVAAVPASAATRSVRAQSFLFVAPLTTMSPGDSLTFTNDDAAPHDVTARDHGPDGRPLFASATVGQGQTVPVEGVEDLPAGTYAFLCSVHPFMTGALSVGAGVPEVPAPSPSAPTTLPLTVLGLVPTPTSVTAHDGKLFVTSWIGNAVYEMPILAAGVPGLAVPRVTGLGAPLGVVVGDDGTIYVADAHASSTPGRSTAGRVWAIPPGGGDAATVGEVVVDELPNGRHNTNGMAIRDGRLFIANGNSTDDGVNGGDPEAPLSGTLLSVPLDARGVRVGTPSEEAIRVEARGLRNVYDVAFRPGSADAWLTFNGPDQQDPWGEDLLLRAGVADADVEDFGFPGCLYGRGQPAPWIQNPIGSDVCDGTQTPPEELMGLHVSADGLAFGPPGGFWDGDLLVAEFGNFYGSSVVGHRVVRVPIDAAGESSPPRDLAPSPLPLDVAFHGRDLYVADFALGVVLVKEPPALLHRLRLLGR